jgi:hypothetical protein
LLPKHKSEGDTAISGDRSTVLSVNWGLMIAIGLAVSFWLLLAFVIYTTVK